MNGPELARFEQRLLARREELLAVADSADRAADTVELDQTRVGRLSRMDALQQQAMSQENQRRRQRELSRITEALRLIKDGEYGFCVDCDEPIVENRLRIDPAARYCIVCASRREKS